jgi:proteasome lid subunit RPN8/RPN11
VNRALLPGADGANGDLQMVECDAYDETDRGENVQPWRLTVTPEASFLMDFHAHLCSDEIIGFLGGTWDRETRTLSVTKALPARRLVLGAPGENAGVEVELDPESVPEIVETLDTNGLRVVGWYHSHPVFYTHPSLRDIENQANYQALFRDDGPQGESMPFVGAIVGPYDLRNASHKSDVRWFHVVPGESGGGSTSEPNGRPFELRCDRDESAAMDSGGLIREVRGLADVFGDPKDDSRIDGSHMEGGDEAGTGPTAGTGISNERADRVDMSEHWRDGMTRMEKLGRSLGSRLPGDWPSSLVDGYVGGVLKYLRSAWNIATLAPNPSAE